MGYDYEIINGRECLIGGQAFKDMPVPLPGPDGPQAMVDENGDHQWIKGSDGAPVFSPLMTEEQKNASKEKKGKIKNTIQKLAELMVEQDVTPEKLLDKIKVKELRDG